MEKRNLQLVAVSIVLVLVCASVFILWNENRNKEWKNNSQKYLSVVWNDANDSDTNFTLDIIKESDIIFKGTVSQITIDQNETEILLTVDEVLKGKNLIAVKILSNDIPLQFEQGEEFIFFISDSGDGNYRIMTPNGYLKKTDLGYEGTNFRTTYSIFKDKVVKSNAGIIEPIEPAVFIDTMEVTYWNPSGGMRRDGSSLIAELAYIRFYNYIIDSDIVVSATVTESIKWTDDTEEGQKKLEELGSPWTYPYGRECYLDVNDVLKGNFEINRIYLKTDTNGPNLAVGEEYILFIQRTEPASPVDEKLILSIGPSNYQILEAQGYYYRIQSTYGFLVKNGSNYEGIGRSSVSKNELENLIYSSGDESFGLRLKMAESPNVFIGKMITSTEDSKLEDSDRLFFGSSQQHQVRVISSIKGNLSGTVNFTYEGAYITNEMMSEFLDQHENFGDIVFVKSNGTGHYHTHYWDPKTSPLKKGNVYLIRLNEHNGEYYMFELEENDFIKEHNEQKLEKMAQEYRNMLE